jgi:hypothetical protein
MSSRVDGLNRSFREGGSVRLARLLPVDTRGRTMKLETVPIAKPEGVNLILGQAPFVNLPRCHVAVLWLKTVTRYRE